MKVSDLLEDDKFEYTTEKQILIRIRQILYDRKLSGTESNSGELNMLRRKLKDLRKSGLQQKVKGNILGARKFTETGRVSLDEAPKQIRENAGQVITLDSSELTDLSYAITELQEEIDGKSIWAGESGNENDVRKLEKDYRALEAIKKVVTNNLIAIKNNKANNYFLYAGDYDDVESGIAGIHFSIENSIVDVRWLGSYNESGRNILTYALEKAKSLGAKKVKVSAKWESEGFYSKMGFSQDAEHKESDPFTKALTGGTKLMSKKIAEAKENTDTVDRPIKKQGKKSALVHDSVLLEADDLIQLNGHQIELLFNPSYQRMAVFAQRLQYPDLRALYAPSRDIVVVWAAEQAVHYEMAQAMQDQLHWDFGEDISKNMMHRTTPLSPINAKLLLISPMVDSQGKMLADTNIHRRAGGFAVVALPEFYKLAWWERIKRTAPPVTESWSNTYKKSINCDNPQGFSQRAHCAAQTKRRINGKTSSQTVKEDLSASQKELAIKLTTLMDKISLVQMPTVNGGKTFIVDLGRRPIVLVNFNGHVIPFYCSTGSGGKANVPAGKWYPFWGVGSDSWFNKGSEALINNFYNSNKLASTAAILNQHLGNLLGNRSIPMAGVSAVNAINQRQRPMSKSDAASDIIKYYARISDQLRAIG